MRLVIVSTADIAGGAANATYRLHTGLSNLGVHSTMLVQYKYSSDDNVFGPGSFIEKIFNEFRPILDKLPTKFYRHRQNTLFSAQWLPTKLHKQIEQLNPNLIHLHWFGQGYIPIELLAKLNKPLVWTLHDMWAFTGGCHYDQECGRYVHACGYCPQLGSTKKNDLSSRVLRRKQKSWKGLNLRVVTPSHWLASCARASLLFRNVRVDVIPNGLDLNRYKPVDKGFARQVLGLPPHKRLVLFGAMNAMSDSRKGFDFLVKAVQSLTSLISNSDDLELVIFGASQSSRSPDFGFPVHYLGTLGDEASLALSYNAADAFVCPSTQDNLPNTVMEAIACGTPCVAFNVGGLADMICHQENGYLAARHDSIDLARGIAWVVEDKVRWQVLSQRARQKAEQEFDQKLQAQRYLSLYNQLILGSRHTV